MPAPSVIRTVSASATGSATITISTLLVDGLNTLLIVTGGSGTSPLANRQIQNVTHNTDACTKQWEGDDGVWDNNQGWTRIAPDAGTLDIVVTFNSVSQNMAGATLLNGVNQGGGASTFGTPVSGGAADTANTIDVGSAVDEVVIAGTMTDDQSGITAGQTQLWKIENLAADVSGGGHWAAGAASVTMAWTQDLDGWASGGISIKGVASSAALTGTVTGAITEADVVAGGKTAILTLTGDTWIGT